MSTGVVLFLIGNRIIPGMGFVVGLILECIENGNWE